MCARVSYSWFNFHRNIRFGQRRYICTRRQRGRGVVHRNCFSFSFICTLFFFSPIFRIRSSRLNFYLPTNPRRPGQPPHLWRHVRPLTFIFYFFPSPSSFSVVVGRAWKHSARSRRYTPSYHLTREIQNSQSRNVHARAGPFGSCVFSRLLCWWYMGGWRFWLTYSSDIVLDFYSNFYIFDF